MKMMLWLRREEKDEGEEGGNKKVKVRKEKNKQDEEGVEMKIIMLKRGKGRRRWKKYVDI